MSCYPMKPRGSNDSFKRRSKVALDIENETTRKLLSAYSDACDALNILGREAQDALAVPTFAWALIESSNPEDFFIAIRKFGEIFREILREKRGLNDDLVHTRQTCNEMKNDYQRKLNAAFLEPFSSLNALIRKYAAFLHRDPNEETIKKEGDLMPGILKLAELCDEYVHSRVTVLEQEILQTKAQSFSLVSNEVGRITTLESQNTKLLQENKFLKDQRATITSLESEIDKLQDSVRNLTRESSELREEKNFLAFTIKLMENGEKKDSQKPLPNNTTGPLEPKIIEELHSKINKLEKEIDSKKNKHKKTIERNRFLEARVARQSEIINTLHHQREIDFRKFKQTLLQWKGSVRPSNPTSTTGPYNPFFGSTNASSTSASSASSSSSNPNRPTSASRYRETLRRTGGGNGGGGNGGGGGDRDREMMVDGSEVDPQYQGDFYRLLTQEGGSGRGGGRSGGGGGGGMDGGMEEELDIDAVFNSTWPQKGIPTDTDERMMMNMMMKNKTGSGGGGFEGKGRNGSGSGMYSGEKEGSVFSAKMSKTYNPTGYTDQQPLSPKQQSQQQQLFQQQYQSHLSQQRSNKNNQWVAEQIEELEREIRMSSSSSNNNNNNPSLMNAKKSSSSSSSRVGEDSGERELFNEKHQQQQKQKDKLSSDFDYSPRKEKENDPLSTTTSSSSSSLEKGKASLLSSGSTGSLKGGRVGEAIDRARSSGNAEESFVH